VKSVRVDDVRASGDVAGMCLGSCCISWLVSLLKDVSTVVAMKMWRGLPGVEIGVLKRIFELSGDIGYQFQDWVILV
jgi:hypothetical protein